MIPPAARRLGVACRALALAAVLVRLVRGRPVESPLVPAPDGTVPDGSVTVVIPARNEAGRVGAAVRSVVDDPVVAEVVVVDDASTDRTADEARRAGARVVTVDGPPAGWSGKTHALQRGLEEATAGWVTFLDADVRAGRGLPGALVTRAQADRTDLLSVAARVAPAGHSATAAHASLLTTLVYRFAAPGARQVPDRLVVSGQCVAVERDEALAWGGLEPVAGSAVEDVALGRWLACRGNRVAWVDGLDLVAVDPYESAPATFTGWGRSVGLPGVDTRSRRFADVVLVTVVLVGPWVRLARGRFDLLDVASLATRIGVLVGAARAFERRSVGYWLSPLLDPVAVGVLAIDLLRRRRWWRGRSSIDGVAAQE